MTVPLLTSAFLCGHPREIAIMVARRILIGWKE
jgi:hypothetical protein